MLSLSAGIINSKLEFLSICLRNRCPSPFPSAASGKGGKGSVHLHREKYITKGGPDGGDGGRGGHVILRGDKNMWTLFHLKFKKHFKADHGGAGSKNRSTGKDGKDIYVQVPLGTIVRDGETQEILFEITN